MLPSDLTSFVWGLVSGALAVVLSSFLGAVGADLWRWLKSKLHPPEPDPVQIDSLFKEKVDPENQTIWVHENRRKACELEGYQYFRHPSNGARCFRGLVLDDEEYFEWLMIKPGA